MPIDTYFVPLVLSSSQIKSLARKLITALDNGQGTAFRSLAVESCYYVVYAPEAKLDDDGESKLLWLLSKPFSAAGIDGSQEQAAEEVDNITTYVFQSNSRNQASEQVDAVQKESFFRNVKRSNPNALLVEYGPRLSFTTAFSTNAVSACRAAGLTSIVRLERSFRYLIMFDGMPKNDVREKVAAILHDRMTECEYLIAPKTFDLQIDPEAPYYVDLLGRGLAALEEANRKLGLAFDDDDEKYYLHLFRDDIKRNPTNVELFDLAQSNSEHSRHWFFKGRLVVDGVEEPKSLFQMVMNTQKYSNQNNVIKFCDNSSGIEGYTTDFLLVKGPVTTKQFEKAQLKRHIIYTAETHNFPTGVCPFPGAATGTGGRIRDVQAAGRGAHVVAGVAGYCFGNLNIPGYKLPWENSSEGYPSNFASPLDICIQASNGASDYGNKFGEPVICGFARSFGLRVPSRGSGSNGVERVEWIKPIMFSGGVGSIDDNLLTKGKPQKGMGVIKLGGPVYRIGVGGGSASSIHVQGEQKRREDLDFGAVQRGDPEMEQKLNRVVRACIEVGDSNPIVAIHDQGAGGNGNVLKEIVEGAGALIGADAFELGDNTISVLELWGAEYQESNAILAEPASETTLQDICERERCPISFVGTVSDDNRIVLSDFAKRTTGPNQIKNPVDLPLDKVLASMPPKVFQLEKMDRVNVPLQLPPDLTLKQALERVLRLPAVASKRYLTNKVDRSVTGLVAQQQCVGPFHTPAADVAVVALSYFDTVGSAVAIGEQPIKGLVNPECGARMAVAEALTNLVFAPITCLKDVKCSANWMWPAKLPGEGATLLVACKAMCKVMNELGIAVDGGKDSLSMAARVGDEVVKAPGSLVISAYAPCPDITKVVTPDFKCPDAGGAVIYVPFGEMGRRRLGGTAVAQCFGQIGDNCADLDDAKMFATAFNFVQQLEKDGLIYAGHDVSDGGIITTVLEMAFAGDCSVHISLSTLLPSDKRNINPLEMAFSEEPGVILEVSQHDVSRVCKAVLQQSFWSVSCLVIGRTYRQGENKAVVTMYDKIVLDENLASLRSTWEETSFELEKLQCNEICAQAEREYLKTGKPPKYRRMVEQGVPRRMISDNAPTVAVIREEGSNGDREMAAAFTMAGFRVWDVTMQDLLDQKVDLDRFRGLAFVGGFSYADVFGSAKGWATGIMCNQKLSESFERFYARDDTFSLGVCNGCQLMCLLAWVGVPGKSEPYGVYLDHNDSGRYESRFCSVQIKSEAMMFKDMVGSVLGVWVSHGEGKFVESADYVFRGLAYNSMIPLLYVDGDGQPTDEYPMNPNGSPHSIAGVCSADGRHLAMMPHPERSFLSWQWPNWPLDWERGNGKESGSENKVMSPWFKMFENAFDWCTAQSIQ